MGQMPRELHEIDRVADIRLVAMATHRAWFRQSPSNVWSDDIVAYGRVERVTCEADRDAVEPIRTEERGWYGLILNTDGGELERPAHCELNDVKLLGIYAVSVTEDEVREWHSVPRAKVAG